MKIPDPTGLEHNVKFSECARQVEHLHPSQKLWRSIKCDPLVNITDPNSCIEEIESLAQPLQIEMIRSRVEINVHSGRNRHVLRKCCKRPDDYVVDGESVEGFNYRFCL